MSEDIEEGAAPESDDVAQAEQEFDAILEKLGDQPSDDGGEDAPEDAPDDEEPKVEQKTQHPGSEYIDLKSATPEQIQARINFLTRQMKTATEDNSLMKREYLGMKEALQYALQEVGGIKHKQLSKEENETIAELKQARKAAYENGDDDAVDKIDDLLLEYKISKREAAKQPAQAPQPKVAPQALDALSAACNQRLAEVDENGNYKYPYLYDTHPDNKRAAAETALLIDEWHSKGLSYVADIDTFFAELDVRVRGRTKQAPTKPANSSVLSGRGVNLAEQGKGVRITLSAEEKRVARGFGMTEQEYFEAKQAEKEAKSLRR